MHDTVKKMRTSMLELPSAMELREILKTEAKRELPAATIKSHFFSFSPIVDLGKVIGLPLDLFTDELTVEMLDHDDVIEGYKASFMTLVETLLSSDHSEELVESCNALYDYLSEEDVIENADLLFVFGSQSKARTEKACELYLRGIAPNILISGRGPLYLQSREEESEALRLKRFAIEKGVPAAQILIEEQSRTIPDNVRASLNMLENTNCPHDTVVLVNAPFAQRRGWAHFKKYTTDIRLIRQNAQVSDMFSRKEWYKNEEGVRVVLNEFAKAKIATVLNTI